MAARSFARLVPLLSTFHLSVLALAISSTVIAPSVLAQSGVGRAGSAMSASRPVVYVNASERPDALGGTCPSQTKLFVASGDGGYATQVVTFTATANMNQYCNDVYNNICSGEMSFYIWEEGGWRELAEGEKVEQCAWNLSLSTLPIRESYIKALYSNDQVYRSSEAYTTVQIYKWPTTTTLTSSLNPSSYKTPVTLTATAVMEPGAPLTPTGKIRFLNGTTSIGLVDLDQNGNASFTTKGLPAGTDAITAEYLGDAYNAASTSLAIEQTVNQ